MISHRSNDQLIIIGALSVKCNDDLFLRFRMSPRICGSSKQRNPQSWNLMRQMHWLPLQEATSAFRCAIWGKRIHLFSVLCEWECQCPDLELEVKKIFLIHYSVCADQKRPWALGRQICVQEERLDTNLKGANWSITMCNSASCLLLWLQADLIETATSSQQGSYTGELGPPFGGDQPPAQQLKMGLSFSMAPSPSLTYTNTVQECRTPLWYCLV